MAGSTTRIIICGAAGRMGAAVRTLALRDRVFQVAGLLESEGHPWVGKTLDNVRVSSGLAELFSLSDVLIDFTAPEAAVRHVQEAAAARKAAVIGTTGLDSFGQKVLAASAKKIPVVWGPNMSLSANLLFETAEFLSRSLADYDVEITEVHHNLKKDAPSGTARRLADSIAQGRNKTRFLYGRHGMPGPRKPEEVAIHALRGGDVVGDHTVFFFGNGERIELVHRVTSRDAFASGALAAAKWVKGRRPGLYDMRDVLGLKKSRSGARG